MADGEHSGPKEIFLSYDRQEAVKAFVLKLKRDLEKNAFTVFVDAEDIPQGTKQQHL